MITETSGRTKRALFGLGTAAVLGLSAWGNRAVGADKPPVKGALKAPIGFAAYVGINKPGALGSATFTDITGKTYTRADVNGHKATVFVFLSCQCPVSNVYTPRFNELAGEWASKGVQVFAVYPDLAESQADVAKHVREHHLTFPAIRDTEGTLVSALGAKMTPESFVVDAQGVVRYHGRFDDNAVPTRVTTHDVADAVASVVKGEPVAHPQQTAFGCVIRRAAPKLTASAGVPTYAHDIAPILRAKCESCHRPGEVSPFSLQDYKQASAWADAVKTYTQNGQMPPWKPVPGYGEYADVHNRTLSDHEKTILAKWADNGAPLGNPKDIPPPAKFVQGWHLGTPDVVLMPAKEYHLGPDGEDVYRNFVIKTNFSEDKWLRAVEFRPGNRAIVHHVINYLDPEHLTDKMEGQDNDGEPGFTAFGGPGFPAKGFLGAWAPGNEPYNAPEGEGVLLPKGANLVLQVHYHRDGKPETDLTKVGLYFAHGRIDKSIHTDVAINFGFKLLPGESRHEARAATTLKEDCHLLSVAPHMHLLGREMKVWATLPDNTEKPLVWIKDWDFNWQMTYVMKEPIALPKGSKIHLVAYFDNSENNPRNPNRTHPRTVTWGEQTTDEMCIAFFTFLKDNEHLGIKLPDDDTKTQSASLIRPSVKTP